MPKKTALYHNDLAYKHFAGEGHPEKAERLTTVISALQQAFPENVTNDNYEWLNAPIGKEEQVLLAHTQRYWDEVRKADASLTPESAPHSMDEDTYISFGSLEAVLTGVGGVCQAIDDVINEAYKNAFVVTRPPGHHALADRAMGFCLFGNPAIGAKYALNKPDINKVAIVDFDVHHGNGTEDIVKDDENILFFSLHQDNIWPYLHHTDQGPHGTINNIGFGKRCEPALWHKAFEGIVIPKIDAFGPDLILISAGFDGHRDDPPAEQLFNDPPGQQNLLEEDFESMTRNILKLADKHCYGRVVSLLEGGYNPEILASCSVSHAKTLITAGQ